jgi:glycosyltransferase involved in cell wall biosynthesis
MTAVVTSIRLEKMNVRNPKVLFFAYHFPPGSGIASVRTWNIAKYLARLGWSVTVVCPDPSLWRYSEDAERVTASLEREGIRCLVSDHRWRCLSPDALKCWNTGIGWIIGGTCRKLARHFAIDSAIGWINEAQSACASLNRNDADVILATGPPFAAFVLAKRLSERLNCPYVLDYRDPWVVHPDSRISAMQATVELERKLIEDGAAVTVVSHSLLNGRLKIGPKLHVVTNGFNPDNMAEVKPYEFGHFAIVYAGNFYPPKRVITPVMEALRHLSEKEAGVSIEWRFHYYGAHGDHVHKEAQRFGITDKIVIHGRVAHAEALSALRGSSVAVVITSVLEEKAEQDGGIVTGKLFELLGMRVPVLFVGPYGADVDHVIEIAGLTRKVTASNIEGMVSFLKEVISGEAPKAKAPDVYAWPNIIKKLDAILRNAIEQNKMTMRKEKHR